MRLEQDLQLTVDYVNKTVSFQSIHNPETLYQCHFDKLKEQTVQNILDALISDTLLNMFIPIQNPT